MTNVSPGELIKISVADVGLIVAIAHQPLSDYVHLYILSLGKVSIVTFHETNSVISMQKSLQQ